MISIRHYLHANPELSLEEFNTSELVASKLTEWGYQVTRGLGKTGVVGSLSKGDSPRTIGLRADMDALPIEETTGLPWASTVSGKMHACGHDGHTTILLAAAKYIASPACQFNGTVHLIFQPAEEAIGGADLMIKDGLFEQFPCERIFGLHNMPGLPVGKLGFYAGNFMASADTVKITLTGYGGHGAHPERTVDPIVAGAALVMALQSIVARNVPPGETAVVSVGTFQAGIASNVIPESVSPMNASEDFAFMLRERPGCYFLLGNGEKGEKGGCMVHNPGYDFNDDIITTGATLFARLVEKHCR